jgi:DNA-binding response OmpR family regulator
MSLPTVLVVDDEANIRNSVRMCLEGAEYGVREACNGSEALERVYQAPPDVMLLDLAMPVMDGMTVLAELSNLWSRFPTRVIVVTAHGSVKTAITAVRLGASDFLEKPFSPDELRASVASVLRDKPLITRDADEDYAQVLEHVRQALRARRFREAERELMKAGTITADDAAFLNLAGILHESHGRIDSARKFYERAIARAQYEPARENLQRLIEVRTAGNTKRCVAFGGGECQDPVSNLFDE